ncbi:MAG: DNA polymerase III subunit epsilon [Steroidobacteraceae bacterium]
MRQIVLDTETTGLEAALGHRVIEIGCVELVSRRVTGRRFHRYLNPDRDIDPGALAVHGLSRQDLEREPRFADVAGELLEFIGGAELVIHNAAFDVAFLDMELARLPGEPQTLRAQCAVLDSLALAREMHPGQRNSLDALCKRYGVDNSKRELHGALLDAQLLAEVYLAMTGGQGALALGQGPRAAAGRAGAAGTAGFRGAAGLGGSAEPAGGAARLGGEAAPGDVAGLGEASRAAGADRGSGVARPQAPLKVIDATEEERRAHEAFLDLIARGSAAGCVWRNAAGRPK